MQCRSHSRRLTSECLFVAACSMDEYAEEKRTETKVITGTYYRSDCTCTTVQAVIADCTVVQGVV